MTADSGDAWFQQLRPQPTPVTSEEYEKFPEDLSRAIEIVDGYIVYCEAPTPNHQTAVRRLTNLVEREARAAMRRGHECLTANSDVDLRLRDIPLLNRRPDVVLYRCLKQGERLRGEHVLLVVEVVSPGSETQDTTDKLGEYAQAGIPHYWLVRIDDAGVALIERYRLDPAAMAYKHTVTLMKELPGTPPTVTAPLPITVDWSDLEF